MCNSYTVKPHFKTTVKKNFENPLALHPMGLNVVSIEETPLGTDDDFHQNYKVHYSLGLVEK